MPLVSSLLSILAMAKSRNDIYLSVAPGSWCVVSFDCEPAILSRLLDTICYRNVTRVPLTFQDYLAHTYRYYRRYEIGALTFDVSSRDPIIPAKFFKRFFRDHFVSAFEVFL